jgi:hypothetical protein
MAWVSLSQVTHIGRRYAIMKARGSAKLRGPTAIALHVLGFVERCNPGSKAVGAEGPLRFGLIVHEHHSATYFAR